MCGQKGHTKNRCTDPDLDLTYANVTGDWTGYKEKEAGHITNEEIDERAVATNEPDQGEEVFKEHESDDDSDSDDLEDASNDSTRNDSVMVEEVEEVGVLEPRFIEEPPERPVIVQDPCRACRNTKTGVGVFRLIKCAMCEMEYHMRNDCANPQPNAPQRSGKDKWKCSVCCGIAAPPQ